MNKFLSAEELRNGRVLPRNLPEKGGDKSVIYLNDDFKEQSELQFLLDDRKQALREPKVEKLSSLIKGEWLPDKRVVRILKNVGRHLQHMGFTMEADRVLYPEEALFLMDVKCMEVFHKNLPLSMQEAHSLFLASAADVLRYQVYSHLSRLGYIIVRYRGRMGLTSYERRIGLDKYLRRDKRNPGCAEVAESTSDEIESIQLDTSDEDEPIECMMETDTSIVNGEDKKLAKRNCEGADVRVSLMATAAVPCLLARHKDIVVPNAYGKTLFALLSASPCLLPPGVLLRKEMYIVDLTKLYLQSNMPPKEFHCHRLRQPNIGDVSISHRFVEQLSWDREQEACKRRKCESPPSTPPPPPSPPSPPPPVRQRWGLGGRWDSRRRWSSPDSDQCSSQDSDQWSSQDSDQWSPPDPDQCNDVPEVQNHRVKAASATSEVKPKIPTSQIKTEARTWKQYKEEVSKNHVTNNVNRLPPRSQIRTRSLSWKQYKGELTVVAEVEKFRPLSTAKCKPLVSTKDATSTASIMKKLQIIPQVRLTESVRTDEGTHEYLTPSRRRVESTLYNCTKHRGSASSNPQHLGLLQNPAAEGQTGPSSNTSTSLSDQQRCCNAVDLLYDVYLPATEYARNRLMLPNHRLLVTSILDPLPSLDLIGLTAKYLNDDVPIHFAVVDHGNIAFYSFNDVAVHVDVAMG